MRRSSRLVGGISIVLCILACVLGGWLVLDARNAPFIAPSAANVIIVSGLNERVITYEMGDPEIGWSSTVARRLALNGWRVSEDAYQWGTTERFIPAYDRSLNFWIVTLQEKAELLGDKRSARIRIVSTLVWP